MPLFKKEFTSHPIPRYVSINIREPGAGMGHSKEHWLSVPGY